MTKEKRVRIVWSPSDYLAILPATTVERYEYLLQEKVTPNTKIQITCKRHGCVSHPTASEHLNRGVGCPECGKERRIQLRKLPGPCGSMEAFLAKAKECHGDLYDYSKVVLGSTQDIVEVICHKTTDSVEHGSFFPSVGNHLYGKMTGCPICATERRAQLRTKDLAWFIERAVEEHGTRYDYSESEYLGSHNKISIRCSDHGPFQQVVSSHLAGRGCRICGRAETIAEGEIAKLLESNGIRTQRNFLLPSGKHIDVYCPDLRVGFEYNGLLWHSEKYKTSNNYHLNKTRESVVSSINLVHIFEDDWLGKRSACERLVLSRVGVHPRILQSTDYIIKEVTSEVVNVFIANNDTSGPISNTNLSLGAYAKDNGSLVAVLCVNLEASEGTIFKVTRFATNCEVVDSLSNMLKELPVLLGVTDCKVNMRTDISKGSDITIPEAGFEVVEILPPKYMWARRVARYPADVFPKDNLNRYLPKHDGTLSYEDNIRLNEYYRVFDCGYTDWSLTLP